MSLVIGVVETETGHRREVESASLHFTRILVSTAVGILGQPQSAVPGYYT